LAALAQQEEQTALSRKQRVEEEQLKERYHGAIRNRVERKWRRPSGLGGNVICDVSVIQLPTGEINDVEVTSCTPNNKALRKSVENAVWAANPLPAAPRDSLFDRRVKFRFNPRG